MSEPTRRRVVKKVDGGHGHHGGAWKVAYADFVTAMMALFMVMWLLASSDKQTRQEISNYFRTGILPDGDMSMKSASQITPSVIEMSPTAPDKGSETLDDAAADVQNKLAKLASLDSDLADVIKNVHVEVTEDGILVEIVDEDRGLLFDSASSKLKEPLQRFLKVLAPLLASFGTPVEINGHTDARPFAAGANVSNWDLSYQRASAARDILVASGFPDGHVAGVFARGSSLPYVPADPYAAQNRRLSILMKTVKPARPAKPGAGSGAGSGAAGEAAGSAAGPGEGAKIGDDQADPKP